MCEGRGYICLSYAKSSLHSMIIPYITDNEIIEVAKSLKNSSPRWDSIPENIAKPSIENYIKPLTRLVNSR